MKYYLHYVGSKLYPKEIFIKEAEQVGVNRCIPMKMIKKLKWGDTLLLGSFVPNPSFVPDELCPNCKTILRHIVIEGEDVYGCPTCQVEVPREKAIKDKFDGRKNKTHGKAEVFGYFQVSGLNIKASDEYKTILINQLNIVSTKELNTKVQRRCGSYTIGTSNIVTNSIEDIINKALELSKQRNEKVKFFVAGQFKTLNLSLKPVNFSRSIVEVKTEEKINAQDLGELNVSFIYDYNKRSYIKKYAKRGRPRKEK